ncbi:hypothetical protein MA9V2_091 [Chryseobacterium phage MA9V-2]|nr:hypothetical protein MA9V2_091 [Chryseobacterium phage MA9V-2]
MTEQEKKIKQGVDSIIEDVKEMLPNAGEPEVNEVAAYIANSKFISANRTLDIAKQSNKYVYDATYAEADANIALLESVAFELLGRKY